MRLLLTGDYSGAEFSTAVAAMRASCEVIQQPCLVRAVAWLRDGTSPADLTVVAQSRPGQFAAAEVEALRRASPLSPLVALVGSWCEGEPRSGSPWPGVVRVYWHQWPTRFTQQLARLARGELTDWNQPPTATPEERLFAPVGVHGPALAGGIAVMSESLEMADWLSAFCRQCGMHPIVFPRLPAPGVEGFDVAIWDAGLAEPVVAERFKQVADSFLRAPVIVLLDFPRSSDVEQFTLSGAAAVLSKPLTIADLRFCMGQIISKPHCAPPDASHTRKRATTKGFPR